MNYIVLAIPVFLLLIVGELVITRIQEKDYYRLSDSISDLGCWILQQLLEVFVKTALFAGYLFLYDRHGSSTCRTAPWPPGSPAFSGSTSSNHRVHHGRDPKYIDRNHGGTLIVCGPGAPLSQASRLAAGRAGRLRPPARRGPRVLSQVRHPAAHARPRALRLPALRGDPRRQRRASPRARLPFPLLAAGSAFVLVSLVVLTALIENRPWAPALEAARLLVVLVAAATLLA